MKKFLVLFVCLVAVTIASEPARAENRSIVVCAALYPCDSDGNVFPEFAEGECADIYQEQCSAIRPQDDKPAMKRRFAECRTSKRNLKDALEQRDRRISQLRAMVLSLRRQQNAQ